MKSYEELLAMITQRGVHPVFGDAGDYDWGIEQEPHELAEFLVAMQALGVTSILEVGTGYKAGLARFLHDDLGWRVTSVDIQNYGHTFSGIEFVHPRDFDHDLIDEAFDLVLIDADHSYEGVKDDHEFYAKYAAKAVAFHDIAGLRDCQGVKEYWQEIASSNHSTVGGMWRGYYEIIADSDQRGGIGYVVLSEVADYSDYLKGLALDHITYKGFTHEIQSGWAKHPEEVAASPALKTAMANRDKKAYVEAQAAEKAPPAKKPAPRKRTPAKKPTGVKK